MRGWVVLAAIAAALLFMASVKYSHGIANCTKKNGDGCVCHDFAPSTAVRVWIHGPDSVAAGSTQVYTLTMTGGPKVSGGYNVASAFGALGTVDSFSQIMDLEVIHKAARAFSNDTVRWKFSYTAPANRSTDTLYGVANSTNNDGNPTTPDAWNYSQNFNITIYVPVPVELLSFSGSRNGSMVTLFWNTATELNNKGFAIERSLDKLNWQTAGFVDGNGTSTTTREYRFMDATAPGGTLYYRLVQNDFNGTRHVHNSIAVNGDATAAGFLLEQNYPNPFNPATTVTFSIPTDAVTQIMVYSAQGALLRTSGPVAAQAGTHSYQFNGAGLATGIYYCRVSITGNGKTEYKAIKMILAK